MWVDANFTAGRVNVSRIVTIHGKNKPGAIVRWLENGYLRYIDKKKAGEWLQSIGRQLPKEATTHRQGKKILQHRAVFKSDSATDFEMRGGETPRREGRFERANITARDAKTLVSDVLTQAMNGKNGANLLALVPGRALMDELGRATPSIKKYLRFKEQMDTLRNDLHAATGKLAQKWREEISFSSALRSLMASPGSWGNLSAAALRKEIRKNRRANENLMELMHDSTIEGQDPSIPFLPLAMERDEMLVAKYGADSKTGKEAQERLDRDKDRREVYDDLRERFEALPVPLQRIYGEVRDTYRDLGHRFEKAIEKAMTIAVRRAERAFEKRKQEIADDGLTGKERADAQAAADAELNTAKTMNQWSKNERINSLRARFEDNKVAGPYFPLARFGDFYVTLRDENGKVVSFSKFEKTRDQRKFAENNRLKRTVAREQMHSAGCRFWYPIPAPFIALKFALRPFLKGFSI